MDSPLNLQYKSLCFGEKKFQNCFKNHFDFCPFGGCLKMSHFASLMKKSILWKKKFRTIRPKKMDFPLNLLPKSLCIGQKNFSKFLKKLAKIMIFFIHFPPPPNKELKTGGWRLWVELLTSSSNLIGKLLYLVQDISWCWNLLAQH